VKLNIMKNKVIAATLALSTFFIGTFAFAGSSNALHSNPQESSVGHRDSFSGSTARPENDSGQDAEYIQFIAILALSGFFIGALAYVSSSNARNSSPQESFAYQAGHRDGFCGSTACPENYPGQETEYMRGHQKGWYDGQGQPRTTF
jgi:cbb3-type cytochrome oxidase subunit 3